ncbi:DUF6600 domain-containing protein [Pedobacter antarcticus]|uniref:DUF6600 domain-containing protein n=1 Tax=Pedobacter antarcticus TaxID=34086 RepID=UPI000885CEBE|nr:DUF6600 domain-containing protein [Pedobacter antarcticus]SDM50437.1 hypothetical protein SAMN04488084_107169 [Pedobacter antarcticus]
MKQLIKLPAIILGLVLLFSGPPQKAMAQYDDISMDSFYDELSPYGTWMNDPQYGRVWRPDVDQRDFRPYYSNGRWAMTEYGNTWVSDYDWGWAPFHYGRWVLNSYSQWLWIPDTVWGPAWVSWRSGGGYYGWAPLGPGINISIGGGGYNMPSAWWVFIPQRNIYSNYYPRYGGVNINIYNRTKIINYTYGRDRRTYYTGPRASEIRRVTNRDVRVYQVSRSNTPGRTNISNNRLNIYNPGTRGSSSVAADNRRGNANDRSNPNSRGDNNNRTDRQGTVNRQGSTNSRNSGTVVENNARPSRSDVNPRNAGQEQNRQSQRTEQQQQAIQQREQRSQQQRDVQSQQRDQRSQQQREAQAQQQDQQRQQRDAQTQQREQRSQQQREAQVQQQRQAQDQQRQQQQQQRQAQDQQRQQQQRQVQDQQRQQQQQQRQAQEQQRQQQQQQRQAQEQSRARSAESSNQRSESGGRSGNRGGRGN